MAKRYPTPLVADRAVRWGYAVAYRREWAERRAALWELTRLSEELGLYDDEG